MAGVKGDGRSTRWEAHRAQRRDELVLAAVSAIDALGADASVADIAAEAGVSKPVLYRYFADKDELHAAVGSWAADLVLERVLAAVLEPLPARERVSAGVAAYVDTLAEHPAAFWLLIGRRTTGSDPLADGRTRIAAKFSVLLGEVLRELGGDAGAAEPWAHSVVGMGDAVGRWWLERRTLSRAAATRYLADLIWHGLAGALAEHDVDLAAFGDAAAEAAEDAEPLAVVRSLDREETR